MRIDATEEPMILGADHRPITLTFSKSGDEVTMDVLSQDNAQRITIPARDSARLAKWLGAPDA
jgi:hypothetical protein